MEILFCDLCNESVPVSDLDGGQARMVKGRVVCAACESAMGGAEAIAQPGLAAVGGGLLASAAEARPSIQSHAAASLGGPGQDQAGARAGAHLAELREARRADSGGGALLALSTLVFAAASFLLLNDKQERRAEEARLASAEVGGRLEKLERRIEAVLSQVNRGLEDGREDARRQMDQLSEELLTGVEDVQKDVADVRLAQSSTSSKISDVERKISDTYSPLRRDTTRLAEGVGEVEQGLEQLADRIIVVEENLRGVVAGANIVRGAVGAAAPGAPSGPAWEGFLADLGHARPSIRLEAVYALGETNDAAVVPHLVPMLADSDLFVRMATIRVLDENLSARSAAPALIDALEDEESAVREAAMLALRSLTGRDFRFDPLAGPGDRSKRVKAWRDWWKRDGEEFLQES